jgi:hypothetical protein
MVVRTLEKFNFDLDILATRLVIGNPRTHLPVKCFAHHLPIIRLENFTISVSLDPLG